jgi:hypothetical protein
MSALNAHKLLLPIGVLPEQLIPLQAVLLAVLPLALAVVLQIGLMRMVFLVPLLHAVPSQPHLLVATLVIAPTPLVMLLVHAINAIQDTT